MIQPILIIHGGVGRSFKEEKRLEEVRGKILRVLDATFPVLLKKSALDAVIHAVELLENDPEFNAGTGARIQRDGRARLSASLVNGRSGKFAGVINVENVKNPILIAKTLLDEEYRVLSGAEAYEFAIKHGFKHEDTRTEESIKLWKKLNKEGTDTVGACALDKHGNLASATSTGGRGMETPGRVSDSGMPISTYATKKCAISSSGIGEHIIDEGLAVKITTRVEDGMSLEKAFEETFKEVRSHKRLMGAIGLDRLGNVAFDKTFELLIYGWKKANKKEIFAGSG